MEIVRERHARAADGTEIFFTDRGKGPAIVLLDGLACDGFVWRYLEPALADRLRIVHLHHRGHGRSATPSDVNTTIGHLVEDLEVVRAGAGLDRMVLCGHSMGVQISLEYARRRPDRVAGMVLVCGSPGHLLSNFMNTDSLALLLPFVQRAYAHDPPGFRWLWENFPVQLAYSLALKTRQVNPLLVRRPDLYFYLRHLRRVDIGLFLSLVQSLHEHDAVPFLPDLAMPALIIAGEHDTFMPPSLAMFMAREMPDAEFLLVRGGSHTTPIEMPELVNLSVERFLYRVGFLS